MAGRVGISPIAARACAVLATLACLAGCGSTVRAGSPAGASADVDPPVRAILIDAPQPPGRRNCASRVTQILGDIATRVYREGVASERTVTAEHFIAASKPLHEAVERGDPGAARAAAESLIAAGRITDLRVSRGAPPTAPAPSVPAGRPLIDVGAAALAPLSGTLTGAGGAPIASYLTSVWSEDGFLLETDGITEGLTALREGERTVAGPFSLPPGRLAPEGTLSVRGVDYRYTSFPAGLYPSGSLRVYVLRPISSTVPLCGASDQDALVNTLTRIARRIYTGELGRHASTQVHRVQHDQALLSAVARRDPQATRAAIESLLHEHVVRLRVSADGELLSDVGGPYVLAPVRAPLRLAGRQIGSFLLSIQDDEGYKRLTKRLLGLDVLMYEGSQLVKNSLGPSPGNPPSSGLYHYAGHTFRVFTLHLEAFPSGPLRVVVLIPTPYS
jgi:hypothetical protein